ncbi:MAG: pyruvate formate lyase family protein [Actinomycetota bacterium]|nr:pyruvate formate lyase family protein [Actinomycetota bacterium]
MTDTMEMKEKLLSLTPELCVERARYITESYKKTEGEPAPMRRARALSDIFANITVKI